MAREIAAAPLDSRFTLLLRVVRKFGWAACSQFGRQALQLLSVIWLARLLSPQDFGVMSLAVVVTGFVTLFRDMGTGAALIQRQKADPSLAGSLFSLNALLGSAAGLATAAVAPFVAGFFDAPVLAPVLQVLAVSLAVAGLGVVPQAVMERDGRFDQLARIELGGVATGVVTGIAMAYGGWGIWSLVGQTVASTLVTTVLLTVASGARPSFHPDWTLLRGVAHYSLNLAAFNVFNYFVRNADNAIVGKLLGSRELGYYALAYQIAFAPLRSITAVVGRVLFPSLARLQDDRPALRREYLSAVGLILAICFPVMALLVALADVGTLALLGESWMPMAALLMVFGVAGFAWSMTITVGAIYMTTGRTDIMMRWGLGAGVLAVLAFWIGARWGALGVAVGYAIFHYALAYPGVRIPFRLVDLPVSSLGRIAARPLLASLLAAATAWWVAQATQAPIGAVGALVAGALAGSVCYGLWYLAASSALPRLR